MIVYLIDLGVRATHEQLAGRVLESRAFDNLLEEGYPDETQGCTSSSVYNPELWHGTAVASVVAGSTIGASHAQIVSLRPTTCFNGLYASALVNAVRWIRGSHDQHANSPAVVSMSMWLGDWVGNDIDTLSITVDQKVRSTGIPFFTSANNFSANACQFSPARLALTNVRGGSVFTVGGTSLGTDLNDYRWQMYDNGVIRVGPDSGSNGGDCVSIYAPAANIYAARTTSDGAYGRASGTSFAAPLVAAIGARYVSSNPTATYGDVYRYLLAYAGSPLNVMNSSTPESWMCQDNAAPYEYHGYLTPPPGGTCPAGTHGLTNYPTVPIHFAATTNSSNAGMIMSPMQCP